ncbi:DUF1456 family protein, partial [Pseudomonas aeruginosa]|uniref:DUF1456 family protein n=1 Tax=Pseudomonas aeruginosa TaxID=287 RepID=UPI0023645DC3
ECPDQRGITVRMRVEWVSESAWNPQEDLHAILDSVDFPVSKPELSALFRKPGHSNYRTCGDQLLRNFLKGLTLRVRG